MYIKNSSGWKQISEIYIKVASGWKQISQGYIKTATGWKRFWSGGTLSPQNPVTISQSTNATTYLITLTGQTIIGLLAHQALHIILNGQQMAEPLGQHYQLHLQ